MNKKSKKDNIWKKTRPVQIALLVVAIAVSSVMIFNNNGNTNSNSDNSKVVSEENSNVLELTDAVFEQTISEGIVLVDFWAVWCPPCRIQNPIVEEVASEIGGKAKIAKLDVDNNPRSANVHMVKNIPTLIIFKDGVAVQRFVGVQQKETLMAAIESHM